MQKNTLIKSHEQLSFQNQLSEKEMKKIILFFWIIFSVNLFSQEINFTIDSLENGLKYVIVQNKKLPLVQVRIVFNGGVRLDDKKNQGLTYLTSQSLLKGTETRTAQQIAEEFEFLGSTINVQTNYDYTLISTEFLKYNFENGLEILSEIITRPAFNSKEIEKEKEKIISELRSSLENPSIIASQFFNKILFNGTPYSYSVQGTINSLESISSRQVRNHYKTYFIPNETVIFLYGDINKDDAASLLKNLFSKWQQGKSIRFEKSSLQNLNELKIVLVDKPGLTQAQIRIGNLGINQHNQDEIPILIVNTILGDGFTSRLVEEIRVKRSLTYGARSSFTMYDENGKFLISTFTKNQTVDEVIKIILNELKKLKTEGVSDWEINKAKNYMIGELSRNLQSPEGFINYFVQIIFYKKDLDLIKNFSNKIKSTSKNSILKVINDYFPANNLLILVVGNSKEIKNKLESFGKIQQVSYEELVE